MASGYLRNSLECSSSGRATLYPSAKPRAYVTRLAALPRAVAPVTRLTSSPQPPWANLSPQPPLRRKVGPRSKHQHNVAQEVHETNSDFTYPSINVDELNELWGIPGAIEFGTGQGDLPTVLLTHPQTGMQLVVYLYGATIAQWLKSDGTATFYDGPDELYDGGQPLRTGVSLHFPQHREGLLPEHGFADSMMWEVIGAGFDTPEVLDQLEEYLERLHAHGLVTEDMLLKAQHGGKAAEKVRAALANEPPPFHTVGTDMSPCITLRLRDTELTRQMWPHKFDLLYKITLMTQDVTADDWKDIRASNGLDPNDSDDDNEVDDDDDEEEMVAGGEEEGEDEDDEEMDAGDEESEEAEIQEEEEEEDALGVSPRGRRLGAAAIAEDDQVSEEDEEHGDREVRRRGRPPKAEAALASHDADEAEEEEEDNDEQEEGEEEHEEGSVRQEPYQPAVQIKQEFWVRNNDEPGSEPMRFNLASLARFVTLQQPLCSHWVKVLGLGGSQVFDYSEDPRYPALSLNEEDYLHYTGQPIDVTYIGASEATVYLCPGNRTHFEFIQREGFRDMFVQQPSLNDMPEYDRVATMGTGYVASMKKLAPGGEWYAQSIIRFHERYWPQPIFGDDSTAPLPPISKEMLEEGDIDEGEGGYAYDGLSSDPSDLIPSDREE